MTSIPLQQTITTRFTPARPVSMAQGRYGDLIVVQGGGIRPARWSGEGEATDAGMDAPATAPSVQAGAPSQFYVARVDVTRSGACYYAPPEVKFGLAGSSEREAKAAAYLSQSALSEIRVTDGGKGYSEPPTVELSDTHGKGAVIEAILDEPSEPTETGPNSKKTGLTSWEVVQGPPFDDELDYEALYRTKWLAYGPVTIPIVNGAGRITKTLFVTLGQECNGQAQFGRIAVDIPYVITGVTTGSGAAISVGFSGHAFLGAECFQMTPQVCYCRVDWMYSSLVSGVTATKTGKDYDDNATVTVTFPAYSSWDGEQYVTAPQSKALVIEGYTRGNAKNTDAPRYPVKSLVIKNAGSGYLVAPQIKFVSDSGFGAYATCKVKDGKIVEVTLENSGAGYKTAPRVEIVSGGAEAFAVSRPHLRGKYQCYYRYVDDTPEDKGGPIPSNLSPVAEFDAGDGMGSVQWSVVSPSGRSEKAELWRSTGDQATTLYRVASVTGSTFTDSLTDDELRDPEREGYAAMPIVLPNGELNANRFGIPPSDKAVVVRFQDRMWYGVDTGGSQPNTIYYSETDEPESVPDSNEIVLQQNARDADRLKAMIPFGAALLLMQERRSYSLTFAKTPVLDAQVTPLAYRGCLNQRCWDIYGGVCYILDQYGVYSISPVGQVESISDQIADVFRDHVDYARCDWAFLLVDAKEKILRAFVAFRDDTSDGHPTRVLCYSLETKAWWFEKYPQRISGATPVRLSNSDYRCVYAGQAGPLLLGEGHTDIGRGSVVSVSLTNAGSGYRTPPTVTAAGGCGAAFQASINKEGSITAIWITSPGYGYTSGSLTISPPNDPSVPGAVQATAVFTATPKDADTPLYPTYLFKGGCAEFATEAHDPEAGVEISRNISLHYEPQPVSGDVVLRAYYNNSPFPRPNVAARNRGIGFAHSTVDAAARYDMAAATQRTGEDTGIATALFAGKTLADIRSGDRHVAVELAGARKSEHPLVFYGININGTVKQEG